MISQVGFDADGPVAVIEIHNPPVNATSQAVRQGLLEAVSKALADEAVQAVVIACAGRTFTAGGDISEFDQPPMSPHLPDVLDAIEASPKPFVAAWHGTALGGGCEIGLACHARIISADGKVGLPEVKLGLVAGAGGTQRLPRLIGPVAALDLMASGRILSAIEADNLGMFDRIATGDLRNEARALALELVGKPLRRLSMAAIPSFDPAAYAQAKDKIVKAARGRLAPLRIVALVDAAIEMPNEQARAEERSTFLELRGSDQSRALRHLFFAERAAQRAPAAAQGSLLTIGSVGVVGGGTMGAGIACAFLDAGHSVTLLETHEAARTAAAARISGLYDRSLKSARLTAETVSGRLRKLTTTTDMTALAGQDLVIEAVFEDMSVKKSLLEKLDATVRSDAIIATNTSYLDVNAMSEWIGKPERFVGLHFFSPAHVMKLLEIVKARSTSAETLAASLSLAKSLGKVAVISGVCDGFIGNRILAKYRAQCEFMLEEGALPHQIDAAMETFGMAMGPFAVQDLAGLDIAWARRKRLSPGRNAAARDVNLVDQLCERGWFGQKAGRGWYNYADGKRQIDPDVTDLVRAHARHSGRPSSALSADDICARVVAGIVNEASKILDEKIAARPSDIDLVMVHGYGFPNWRGGPMHFADQSGLAAIMKVAAASAERDGVGFEVSPLLADLVRTQRCFSDLNAN